MNIKLHLFADPEEMLRRCANTLEQTLAALNEKEGIMLSGGKTPLEIYRRLASREVASRGMLFLSDERYVPVTDPQSNFGGIAPFFKGVPDLIPIRTDLPLNRAAQIFHDDLSRIRSIPLGLLGLGADGHTASIFTREVAALRDERLAIPVIKAEKPDRISVTSNLLNKVQKIIILAVGEGKKEIIRTLLDRPRSIPAGIALADHPRIELWTDSPPGESGAKVNNRSAG